MTVRSADRGRFPTGAADDDDEESLEPFQEGAGFDNSTIGLQADLGIPTPIASARERSASTVLAKNVDPFANINACTPEQIQQLARILEIRGSQPRQRKMREKCFTAARLKRGAQVLEVGCGTGIVTRELSNVVGPAGKIVGVDVSPALLSYARGKHVSGGAPIEYKSGDAYSIPFGDRAFDASCAVTLLAHLGSLDLVVKEMVRVTRETVMLLDQDYQTLVFEHGDTALTRKILLHGADHNVLDGWCGRKLPGLLVRHRIRNVQCWPFVYSERDAQSYLITIAERFASLAVRQEAITEDAARAWLQELYDRAAQGEFFASLNYYFAFGFVPN